MTKKAPTRVLIVDDHPLVRRGIGALINGEKDFTVCGEVSDSKAVIDAIRKTTPDIVLLDITLAGASGIEVLKNVKAQFPTIRVLMLSMHDESIYAPRALRAGAMGYIMKQESPEQVITALRHVLKDQVYVSPQMATKLLTIFTGKREAIGSPVEVLSDRELEIFTLLGQGHSTAEIAAKLNLSRKTVEAHRAHIKQKLHLSDATQLMRHAIEWTSHESSSR